MLEVVSVTLPDSPLTLVTLLASVIDTQLPSVDGGFAKLRQVSATYTFPQSWLRPIGLARASATLSAQNMATLWVAQHSDFGVKLTDPEVRNSAGSGADPGGLTGYNQEGWPQLRRVLLALRVTP